MDDMERPAPQTPVESAPPGPRWRGKAVAVGLVAAGAVGGGVLASTLTASAADTPTPAASTYPYAVPPGAPDGSGGGHGGPGCAGRMGGAIPMRPDETRLTGSDAAKAKAAALKAVPGGTVHRVETDSGDAAYEAHMSKADGTPVTVKLDKNFDVTAVEDGMGLGDPRPRPPSDSGSSSSNSA